MEAAESPDEEEEAVEYFHAEETAHAQGNHHRAEENHHAEETTQVAEEADEVACLVASHLETQCSPSAIARWFYGLLPVL